MTCIEPTWDVYLATCRNLWIHSKKSFKGLLHGTSVSVPTVCPTNMDLRKYASGFAKIRKKFMAGSFFFLPCSLIGWMKLDVISEIRFTKQTMPFRLRLLA